MLAIRNETPFEPMIAVFPDIEGVDTLHAFVQATFSFRGSTLDIAEHQIPVPLADEYNGSPGRSSLRRASELHIGKKSTDVVMIGDAWAPSGYPVTEMDVELSVGPVRKFVRVFGDREWQGLSGHRISHPVPFERMPLVYERAFGGILEIDEDGKTVRTDARNPIGVGPARLGRNGEASLHRLPNLEDPFQLIESPTDEPSPAGFGFIAPSWEPRRLFAGTYDEAWTKTRAPFLPRDFDFRFLNAATPGLICDTFLEGGESIHVNGASPDGPIRLRLPKCNFDVSARLSGKTETMPMHLQTVLIESNEKRLGLAFHGSFRCDKRILQVEEVLFALRAVEFGTRSS